MAIKVSVHSIISSRDECVFTSARTINHTSSLRTITDRVSCVPNIIEPTTAHTVRPISMVEVA
eukprot:scaffold71398_cov32-Attheya_sp.AAC.1